MSESAIRGLYERSAELARKLEAAERREKALREALSPFAAGGVIDSLDREDYSIMRERIVDWFGPSDFRKAKAALADTEEPR